VVKETQPWQKKAKSLARLRLFSGILEVIVLLGLLFAFWWFWPPISVILPSNLVAAAAVYFLIIGVSLAVVDFPLAYYREFVLPRRYGLLSQSFGEWLTDSLRMGLPSFLLLTGMVSLIYFFILESPQWWWLFSWALIIFLSLLINLALPGVILPRFYKLEELKDEGLNERLFLLLKRAGREVKNIYVINLSERGNAANAALVGIGSGKKIVLGDNLLGSFTPEEVEVILAHELGHDKHADSYRLFAFQTLFFLIILYLTNMLWEFLGLASLADPAGLPLLLLLVSLIMLILLPFFSFYSRTLEERADRYALELTQNPDSFISMMTKITRQNLVSPTPSPLELFFSDHPSYSRRVALATAYKEAS
jgi:STE24 endopeptidase